jgi:DNA-binding NtrC family response regulator
MCFYLPLVTSGASPAIESRSRTPLMENARILVVDDEDVLRDVACEFFNQAGFLTSKASSSDEALRIFDEGDFDLVITDMVMPGMNGKQLGDELKKRDPHLPIVYISGYAKGILENQGQLAPGDILFQKPYSLQKLAQLVEAELEKRSSPAVQ